MHPYSTTPRGTLEEYAGRLAIAREIRRYIECGEMSIIPELIGNNWSSLKSGVLKKALKMGDRVVAKVLD